MDYFRTSYMDDAYMAVSSAIYDMLVEPVDYLTASIVVAHISVNQLKGMADNLSELIYISTHDDVTYDDLEGVSPIVQVHRDIVFNSPYLLSICYSMLAAALNKIAGPSVDMYYAHQAIPALVDVTVTDYADYLKYVVTNEQPH